MKTKLVSITKSLIIEKELNPEELIVYIARVSNPSNQLNSETSEKLINYMIKNKHWSPFEMVDMTVEIVTSRAIAAQILRHRSFSFQEFSQRYSKATKFEDIIIRRQANKNRQSSSEEFDPFIVNTEGKRVQLSKLIDQHIENSMLLYEELIKEDVAKECARMVLPLTTQTKLYMKGSIRSWIHYLNVRCDEHAQLEHREIAFKIKEIFESNFPIIYKSVFN